MAHQQGLEDPKRRRRYWAYTANELFTMQLKLIVLPVLTIRAHCLENLVWFYVTFVIGYYY
jgi:hypothetical protein